MLIDNLHTIDTPGTIPAQHPKLEVSTWNEHVGSFKDGDGMGDLWGVLEKLDYILRWNGHALSPHPI